MSEDQSIRVGDVAQPVAPQAPPTNTTAGTFTPPQSDAPLQQTPKVDLYDPPTATEMAGKSPMQQLQESLSEPAITVDAKRIRVPSRRGVELEFDPARINSDNRKAWQKRATKKSRRQNVEDEVDDFLFSCLVLANTHIGTLINGREAYDSEGTPLTFAHAELWGMVSADDPQECIRNLFANDQHVSIASGDVLLAAGFDDDLTADPTAG